MEPSFENVVSGAKMAATALMFVYKHFKGNQKDRVVLEAKLEPYVGSVVLERVGSPVLQVTVISRGTRPAKLESVFLEAEASPAVVESLERGFGFSLGQSKNPELPPPRVYVDLHLMRESDQKPTLELTQDDAAKFVYPVAFPGTKAVLLAPSESVRIGARLRDGSVLYLQQGLNIQDKIRDLLDATVGMPMTLKMNLKFGITVSAEGLPNVADKINAINSNPVEFGERILTHPSSNLREQKCISVVSAVWEYWTSEKTDECRIEASHRFELVDIDTADLANFTLIAGHIRVRLSLIELLNVFDLFATNIQASREAEPGSTTLEVHVHFRNQYGFGEITKRLSSLPIVFPQEP
jgi:hypothetical protein